MNRTILRTLLSFALLCFALPTLAVSPELVRAVADQPVTVELHDGRSLQGDILSLHDGRAIFSQVNGQIEDIAFDAIRSVQVRTRSFAENARLNAAQRRDGASAPPEPRAPQQAAPPQESQPSSVERRSVASGRDDSGVSSEERENRPRSSTPHSIATSNSMGQEASEDVQVARPVYPRPYFRASIDSGYGAAHLTEREKEYDNSVSKTHEKYNDLSLGAELAIGRRVSQQVAIHVNVGLHAVMVSKEASEDAGEYKANPLGLNIGLGTTLHKGIAVAGISIGVGRTSHGQVGFSGDALVGVNGTLHNGSNIGLALAGSWIVSGQNIARDSSQNFHLGPRLFIAY